jgi:hypothetical protein
MDNRYQNLQRATAPHLKPPNLGGMVASSVAIGSMFTVWNYARHLTPYKQFATLALGGAAVSVGQQLVRNAVKAASR